MRRYLAAGLALSLCLNACQSTQQKNPTEQGASVETVNGVAKITEVEGIREYRLENGLKVLLFPDASKPRITVNLTYFVGSRNEGAGEAGMAHLLEHMLFKGTKDRPDIWKMLQDKGANFNGTTSYDRTNYYEILPASTENLEFALGLEADRMVNSAIAAEQLAKEFSVVRNEFELGNNNPEGILYEYMFHAAFHWHNYGRTVIGNRSDIEQVPADRLRAFYKQYYQPDNAMLIVTGSFEEKDTLERIKKYFAGIPKPERKLPENYTVEPVQEGERQVVLRRQGEQASVGVLYHGVAGADPQAPALDALVSALTQKPSGFLYKELVVKGYAAEISAESTSFADPGAIVFIAKVAKGKDPKDVSQRLVALIEGLKPEQITETDLKRFQSHASRDFDLAITDSARVGIVLSEYAAAGDWRLLFLNRDRNEALQLKDVRAGLSYFKAANRTVGLFLPTKNVQKAPLPAKVDVASALKGYKGRAEVSAGEAWLATFDAIAERTKNDVLQNGMKIALLPKKTRGAVVSFQIDLSSGNADKLKDKLVALHVLPRLMMRGTTKRNFEQLKDDLSQLKATFGGSSNWNFNDPSRVSFEGTTVNAKLPQVLSLAHEVLTQPRFDPAQFQLIKRELLSAMKEAKDDPGSITGRAFYQRIASYPKGDVRYIPSMDEEIKAIESLTLSDVKNVYTQLLGASHGTLVMVGDFDPAAVKTQLNKEIGTWKSPGPFQAVTFEARPTTAGVTVFDTPDKKAAQVFMGQSLALKETDPTFPASRIAGFIWGESISSRLMNRLRQKDGLSYGTGGGFHADGRGNLGFFSAAAACAPENVEKATKAMTEELERFHKDGVSADELKDAKAAYAEERRSDLARDGFIVDLLSRSMELGRPVSFYKDLDGKIEALKLDEVNSFIKSTLSLNNVFTIQALDKKTSGSATAKSH